MVVLLFHIDSQFPGAVNEPSFPTPFILFNGLFSRGDLGVDLFFVISGFIIFYIHHADLGRPDVSRRYLLKRIIRIHPMLLLIISLKLFYLFVVEAGNPDEYKQISRILGSFLALPGYNIVGVAWTLSFEYLFYLFFLFSIILGERFFYTVAISWTTSIVVFQSFLIEEDLFLIKFLFSPYVIQFFIGVMCAWLFLRGIPKKQTSWLWFVILLLFLSVCFFYQPALASIEDVVNTPHFLWTKIYWGITFGLLIVASLPFSSFFEKKEFIIPVFLGNTSYSLYLFHNEIITFCIRISEKTGMITKIQPEVLAYSTGLITLFTTSLIYLVIEKPLLKFFRTKLLSK